MSRHQEEMTSVEAGPVTLKGTPEEVETLATAAGLYGERRHRRRMSHHRDEDHVMTGVYIGVGLLLAAGAGYLAWRYALSDSQKSRLVEGTKEMVSESLTKGKRAMRGRLHA